MTNSEKALVAAAREEEGRRRRGGEPGSVRHVSTPTREFATSSRAMPDAYDCTMLPQACRANPTCACVKAAIGNTGLCMVASCDESDGDVEVHCLGV